MALSIKQRVFIEQYLVDFNATQAAIRAGYSARTAYSIGQENLKKPEIAKELQHRLDALTMTENEILVRLTEQARGDIGDFLDIGSMGYSIDLKKAKELGITHLIRRVKQMTTITSTDKGDTENHRLEIELYDAQAALQTLAKIRGMMVDKTELSGAVNTNEVRIYIPDNGRQNAD